MSTKNKLKHYVLIGPSGKQAGRKYQHKIALQLATIDLTKKGRGGGIINGLLPKTAKEKMTLDALTSRGYTAREVDKRNTYLREVREAVKSDLLIAQLAVRYELERGGSRQATAAVIKDFSVWICKKFLDQGLNDIKKIASAAHPELLNMTKPDWWKKQLNQRVKK